MEKYIISCVLLIFVQVGLTSSLSALDTGEVLNTSNANVTFQCQCQELCNANQTVNQSTYYCDCQTYLVSHTTNNRSRCFYDCNSKNYTCQANKTCEDKVTCSGKCHHNATCRRVNDTAFDCVCNKGFQGDGETCECVDLDCGKTQPKWNCSCENRTYCCSTNATCPANCPTCKEEHCLTAGNLTCWCNMTCDKVHGNFSEWSDWSKCSRHCGVGTENRTRNCSNPAPYKGGRNCSGNYTETRSCNLTVCPTIAFIQNLYTANERDSDVKLEVKVVSGKVLKNITISVFVGTDADTARKSEDYNLTTEKITFTPNDHADSKFIIIDLMNDYLLENDENFTVMFTVTDSNSEVNVGMNSTKVTIKDDDVASVKFERSNYSVAEKDHTFIVTVILTGNLSIPVFTRLNISSITAEANKDYKIFGNNITFDPNGSNRFNVSVSIIDDYLVENNETFSLTLSQGSPRLVLADPNNTVITIEDNDVAFVSFERSNYSVSEEQQEIEVCIILTGNITIPLTARLTTGNLSSEHGKDYNSYVRDVTFDPNGTDMNYKFLVEIINDDLDEKNETFSVKLSSLNSSSLYVVEPNNTVITIVDDDVDGNFSIWSNWNNCSRSCGVGIRKRTRTCTNPAKLGGGKYCIGNATETAPCNITLTCPGLLNCSTLWSNWSNCSGSCESGSWNHESRTRLWHNVVGAEHCNGTTTEFRPCFCPAVHGNFSNWYNWEECSKTCGGGIRSRTRNCTKPSPKYGGKNCSSIGNSTQTESCETKPCREVLSSWSNWTLCSVTCGNGAERRWCLNTTGYGCNGTMNETRECVRNPCPVDGNFTAWSSWTACTQTCGSGVIYRRRTCEPPQYGGQNCSNSETTQNYVCSNPVLCPGEEDFSPWSEWGECNVKCKQGIQFRQRTCESKFKNCSGDSKGNKTCDMGPCPVEGGWSDWTGWSNCPGICGSGFINRTRKCDKPVPLYGGANCTGTADEVRDCNHSKPCTGESGFTGWSLWTPCSTSCGDGVELRTRECKPEAEPSNCVDAKSQEKYCYIRDCPINGEWSSWNVWSRCSKPCGSGVRHRKRTCTNPAKSIDGLPCYGNEEEEALCVNPDPCEDDYAYNNWGSWTDCNVTCGHGKRVRKRKCHLLPKYPPEGDLPCKSPDKDYEYISCFPQACPIDGNFTNWSLWSLCDVTCGDGVRQRTRSCTYPTPSGYGRDCTGKRLDVQDCYTNKSCPDDNLYQPWSAWTNCSEGCEGSAKRIRNCNITFDNCTELNRSKGCNTQLCDKNGGWSEWTSWTSCDLTKCGPQQEHRERLCDNPKPQAAGNYCIGLREESNDYCSDGDPVPCETNIPPGGWTDWSWWKACSKSCGGGVKSRHRKCSNPAPKPGGLNCTGESRMTDLCNIHPCPVDGKFTEWTLWTNCTKECGNGTRRRNRSCTQPEPRHGGIDCDGVNSTRERCNVYPCPIDGGLTPWSRFSFCSKPCNRGSSVRTRSCDNPTPKYGGRNCSCSNTGDHSNCNVTETKYCNIFVCPPVRVEAGITFDHSSYFYRLSFKADSFKRELNEYIVTPYRKVGELDPVVGFSKCRTPRDHCVISISFNFSDGVQLPILRDVLDQPPGSNVSLQWMNSSVVLSTEINMIAHVLSSTSIKVNWSLTYSAENISGIIVFYKIRDGTVLFHSAPVPPSMQGGTVLVNLEKFTPYKITVSATTMNGTGVPSRFANVTSLEDVPSKAPQVQVISPSSTSLKINWAAIDKNYLHGIHRGYCLYFEDTVSELSTEESETTKGNLKPYTKYDIQVAVRTTPGCGARSKKMLFLTLEDRPGESPQDVTAHNESSKSLRVDWQEVKKEQRNGIILGYHINYTDPAGVHGYVHITSATILHTVIPGLKVWTMYNVSVAAYTKIGQGPAASVRVSTDEETPRVPPEIIVAENTSSSTIYVKWREINDSGYGILLGYRIIWSEYNYTRAKTRVVNVPLSVREHQFKHLYYYWQYNITIGGYTRPGIGKVVTKIVRTDEHPPGRSPENVKGVAETSTSIYVTHEEVTSYYVHGILLGYNITLRKTNDLTKLTRAIFIKPPFVKSGVATYVKNLEKYTEYTIWVRAVNSKGEGRLNSPEGYQVRTKEDAPEAPPSNIRVQTLTSSSTLNLQWKTIPLDFANGIIRGYYVEYTAINLNGQDVDPAKRVTKTFRVRGNRYATILKYLIPASKYEIKMFGYTIKNGTKSDIVIGETCRCPEYLKVNWWNIPPYTDGNAQNPGGIFSRTVNMMLDMCGTCKNGHGKTKACYRPGCDQHSSRRRRDAETYQQNSFQQVLNNINKDLDISFPVQGNKYLTHYGGVYPYISIVETSGSVLFTVKDIPSTSHVLVNASLYSIPLLLLITLLSLLAGMVIWVLERSTNPTSFPLSFTKGLKEGFWWAFISASTVGYGDRRPVTIPGKLFAILWILVGYVVITLLTSLMVNSITSVLVTQKKSVYGAKIAAVQNSSEHSKAIRLNGEVKPFSNVDAVIEALENKIVDGALLDMYAAATRKDLFKSGVIQLTRQVEYPSGYGIVLSGRMKDTAPMINEYFKKRSNELLQFIQNNTDVITQKSNQVQEAAEKKSGLFDASSEAYQLSMIVILSLLGASLAGGMFWHVKYHTKAVKVRENLRNSTRGYSYYKHLREDVRLSCNDHCKHLIKTLQKLKEQHKKELKLLAKCYKESGRAWPVTRIQVTTTPTSAASLNRIRKMTASVTPSLNNHSNIALQVMDMETEHEGHRSKDSQV